MTRLVKLLNEGHGEAIEGDLRIHAGVRLRDLWDPASDLTPREVWSYLLAMPDDSAYVASLRGGRQFRGWDSSRYLLANIQDLLAGANYQRSGGKGRKPQPVKRPRRKTSGVPLSATIPRSIRRT